MSTVLSLRACAVRMADGVAVRDGAEVPLTTKERDLLEYLSSRPRRVVSREALLVDVWEYDRATVTRAVDMVVARLRRKIELNPANPDHLITVTGVGYRFEPELPESRDAEPRASTNVTAALSSFVGRARDLAALDRHVRAHGLVTVMGPPGVGKTRLVREYARKSVGRYQGGVWFCGLADAGDADDVRAVVAGVLGVEGDEVGRALGAMGTTLLILDNLEHLVDAAPEVLGPWRRRAPNVTVLATSRVRLGLEGEHRWRLEPLPRAAARSLLSDRVDGRVDAADEVLDALVERLDRLPLAIELAAARLDLLSPAELLDRLSAPLVLLRSPRRDRSRRQTTLAGAIGWSWDLLDPDEQALLAACTVFRGGFTLEAAERVLVADGGAAVLDGIHALWDKSLLDVHTVEGRRRFALLPSIAAFAAAHLDAWTAAAVRERHTAYYLAHAEDLAGAYEDHELVLALERERENLLAACEGAGARRLVRALQCLRPLLYQRGPHARWLALCDDAVRRARDDGHAPTLAAALTERAHARQARAEGEGLERDCREVLALDGLERAVRLNVLEMLAQRQLMLGDLEGALASSLERLSLADRGERAACHADVGMMLTHLGRFDEARTHLDRALALHRAADHPIGVHNVHAIRAYGMRLRGDLEAAWQAFTECAAGCDEDGHGVKAVISHGELAGIALELGWIEQAEAHLEDVQRWIERLGLRDQVPDLCLHRGLIHHLRGDLDGAREAYERGMWANADQQDQDYTLRLEALRAVAAAAQADEEAAGAALRGARLAAEAIRIPIAAQIAAVAETYVALCAGTASEDAVEGCIATARATPPGMMAPALRTLVRFLERASTAS